MAYTLKDKIFSFFGVDAKVRDTYKDINGKGISERYQECIGEQYDDDLSDKVDNFIDRTMVPAEILAVLIPHMEDQLGNPVIISNAVARRRKIIQFAHQIYNIKSTALSYEVLLRMLGFATVVVNTYPSTSGFDSDLTFDDINRTFDRASKACTDYDIELTGVISITQDVYDAVYRIIEFLEPIDGDLKQVTYNGTAIIVSSDIFDDTFDSSFQ